MLQLHRVTSMHFRFTSAQANLINSFHSSTSTALANLINCICSRKIWTTTLLLPAQTWQTKEFKLTPSLQQALPLLHRLNSFNAYVLSD
ncbi:hypothetical protein QL285_054865 [Trifolium repens]|nr:hypothetical protein QL285_054865 [Trifolium repens]